MRRGENLSQAQPERHVRAELAVRDAVVRTRTRYVAVIKALVRRRAVCPEGAGRFASHGVRWR